jgi:uncharacterized protein (DUF427 family)
MGLAWQQGLLSAGSIGRFLTAHPMPEHLLFAEPLRRRMRVRVDDDWIADSENVLALHEPGHYPVAYFPREDIDEAQLEHIVGQTFCPYKGLADYYTIGDHKQAAWSYIDAWQEPARISNLVSFEPDKIEVWLDDRRLHLESGQSVVAHGVDRGLDSDEVLRSRTRSAS